MSLASAFDHVTTWVFDLDETLYPPTFPLFPQIEARMAQWIVAELGVDLAQADALRRRWWHDHGTTLAGLMREHGADPAPFLAHVHDIDFSVLRPDPDLRAALAALPGRRVIYTNGTAPYAEKVLAARGLSGMWDAVHGIEHADHHPKPDRAAFETVFARDRLDPMRSAMFEDSARNLSVPHELGLVTVHVGPERAPGAHIHHHAPDLTAFLRAIVATGT
ncbi:MAG: pyrimidine 5'-nucleotidase [Jannaschia helgolandensis]|jgi:putative hydrolase of the HAD superfamily|uniref:Putative hydrolase of the HAD superfamily n=1 Tax=Jannaschia helgolandensis TaxID=188906 RepID=A0A1H7RWF1_9RHOB|nr:pyrimidine 5'-nucleotidase [Jannaschia helgolandensis]SEL64014.1 putative hydrolase of the HAD superfamily [Jannaschia helgolandensis]